MVGGTGRSSPSRTDSIQWLHYSTKPQRSTPTKRQKKDGNIINTTIIINCFVFWFTKITFSGLQPKRDTAMQTQLLLFFPAHHKWNNRHWWCLYHDHWSEGWHWNLHPPGNWSSQSQPVLGRCTSRRRCCPVECFGLLRAPGRTGAPRRPPSAVCRAAERPLSVRRGTRAVRFHSIPEHSAMLWHTSGSKLATSTSSSSFPLQFS